MVNEKDGLNIGEMIQIILNEKVTQADGLKTQDADKFIRAIKRENEARKQLVAMGVKIHLVL